MNLLTILTLLCSHIIDTIIANSTDNIFEENLINSKHFVDKSDFLKDLFSLPFTHDYITCPRGFGKTTNLRMIEQFSQIEFDANADPKPSKETRAYQLFKGLKIFQHETTINQHLARHPVIFLDLGYNIEGSVTIQEVITSLNSQLNEYFNYFKPKLRKWYLREIKSKALSEFAIWTKRVLQESILEADIETSLHMFALSLHHCFGSKVIVLIDGFDYFVNHAFKSADSIGSIYSKLSLMVKNLFADFNHRLYILMAGTTTISFEHNHFHEYVKVYSFLDDHAYSKHFGFNEEDLQKLFDSYGSSKEEIDYVKKYYAGYKCADKFVKYNIFSVTNYFKTKEDRKLNVFQKPGQKSIFVSKFFKNPYYLENVSVLIKHCSVRGKFQRTYEPRTFRTFIKYVKNNFQQINASKCEMMFTFSIEHGFFAPIQQDAYIIPNYDTRNNIMANLRSYYENQAFLDLARVSGQLREIMTLNQLPSDELKYNFSRTLTKEFRKLVGSYETNLTTCFVLQSIIHVAARIHKHLKVIEDYPTPVSYDDTKENVEKRCVTLITGGEVALVVKVTYCQSVQAALYKAMNYFYDEEDIRCVRCLGIDVNFRNKISIAVQDQNRKI